jgi:hypothetical protein
MTGSGRRKPFSNKQKKAQLQLKRETKRSKGITHILFLSFFF